MLGEKLLGELCEILGRLCEDFERREGQKRKADSGFYQT
jgi:hypothetical protein